MFTVFPRFVAAAAGALLLALAGCSSEQELYGQLSERQANEMVAVLYTAGIKAEKQTKDGKFSISTSRDEFAAAVRALNAQGYPREQFDSMGKVFKREGFVSSPLEERARLMHAMSQEIANTIANIDGVITARVHLVMPEHNPMLDKPQPSAAAVFIKHRADVNLQSQVTQIKALVVNSIEGLKYSNVTVALFPAEAMPGDNAPKASASAGTVMPALNRMPDAAATPIAAAQAALAPNAANASGAPNAAAPGPFDSLTIPVIAAGAVGVIALVAGLLMSWRRRGGDR